MSSLFDFILILVVFSYFCCMIFGINMIEVFDFVKTEIVSFCIEVKDRILVKAKTPFVRLKRYVSKIWEESRREFVETYEFDGSRIYNAVEYRGLWEVFEFDWDGSIVERRYGFLKEEKDE